MATTSAWKGEHIICPSCQQQARVYIHHTGKLFHCLHCKNKGPILSEEAIDTRNYKVDKETPLGKKLSWLLEIPCQHWKRRELMPSLRKKHCANCEIKAVCDAHTRLINRFTKNKEYDIFISADSIDFVGK